MNNQQKLNCPACSTPMQTVTTKSHYDFPIMIEQCKKCGGIWFNDIDFHKVKHGEANNIEILDKDKLQEISLIENPNLHCPKDNSILVQFKDLGFPKEIIIEKCLICNGFWFNRGELLDYQNKIKERKEIEKPKVLPESDLELQVRKLLEANSDSEKYGVMRDVASFLSSPIDRMTLQSSEDNPQAKNVNKAIGVAFGFLQFIMRLFLK